MALSSLVTLTFIFRPLSGATGHPCYGVPYCQFSASYALLFSTEGQAWETDAQTERQTDR